MTFFRHLGKKVLMSMKIKQSLKQLRKALHEQREYEMFLRTESTQRYDTFVGKLIPLIPVLMSTFASSSNAAPSAQAGQLLLLTKLVRSLTDDQVAVIQEHLSIEQKKHLLELLRSITQESPPSAARAAPHTSAETPSADLSNTAARHWFYPNSAVGCGLSIDDLPAEKLTCLRHEVTCAGCLAQLRADQEKNPSRAKGDAAAS
jgi:hypothetical protein